MYSEGGEVGLSWISAKLRINGKKISLLAQGKIDCFIDFFFNSRTAIAGAIIGLLLVFYSCEAVS